MEVDDVKDDRRKSGIRETMEAVEEARAISGDPDVKGMTYEEYLSQMRS